MNRYLNVVFLPLVAVLLAACNQTSPPPVATEVAVVETITPTQTPIPVATETPVPPTVTPVPQTATSSPTPSPTATPTATASPTSTATPTVVTLDRVHTDKTVGYSISYPSDWEFADSFQSGSRFVQIIHPSGSNIAIVADPFPDLTLDLFFEGFMEGFAPSEGEFREISRAFIDSPPGYLIDGVSLRGIPVRLRAFLTVNEGYGIAVLAAAREELFDIHEETISMVFDSFEIFPAVVSTAIDRQGLWVGGVSDPALTEFFDWISIELVPGTDPDLDLWRLSIFGLASRCAPMRLETGWRLIDCTDLDEIPDITDIAAFVPEEGDDGVELVFNFESETFTIPLARLHQRSEPQASDNVTLLWHTEGQGTHSDIWADSGLVFAPRFDGSIEVLDAVSGELLNIINIPDVIGGLSDSVQDVKYRDNRLYAATVFNGIVVFDLSQPADPTFIGEYHVFIDDESQENFEDIHNIFMSPEGAVVYAINHSSINTDLRIIDFDDPSSPVEIGRYELGTDKGFVHDINVIQHDDLLIAFLNYWDAGLLILDVTDSEAVSVIGNATWDGITSHSGWPFTLDEKLYYVHAEEGFDRHLTVLDVTDFENPEVVSQFGTRPNVSVHNVEVVDGIAYVSYYIDGLRVVDLRDPENPKEIGHFDTVAAEDERGIMGQGAFGVHVAGDTVFLSDMQSGTYAFKVDVEGAE